MRNLLVILFLLQFVLSACSNPNNVKNTTSLTIKTPESKNLPRVVVTTSVLCDLTKQVAGNTINLTCLIPPDINPKRYQVEDSDASAIADAKLILYNGYNLEPAVLDLIRASKNPAPKIAVGERAVTKPKLMIQEGSKRLNNPYLWHNPKNVSVMVDIISNNLNRIAPENANLYAANGKKIKGEINKLDTWIKSRVASIPSSQRKLITNNLGIGYYTQAYGIKYETAFVNVSNDEKSASSRLKPLIKNIRQSRVPSIFITNVVNPKLAKTVAKEADVRIAGKQLFVYNLGMPGSEGDTYQKMMAANTRTIVEGLGGTYLKFEPMSRSQK
ncbi:metal ABC transporter solute-binding protein, Zn/Mn family [Brunnivagina elsteri]|uniref:Metal ABC transporter substrate-binding protein n=1 Tax=Brunnivagina elsteri CCALA 953 TaxID=987040 RepID=A0A2A2TM30_9CYAN|nr:zinc ABC transporter substrate-binding protein [Calothrix elsteri]PAX59615.1 metal ABC transporter substrate-binding protein [Calothrix elsteri CCALA 953]